MSRFRFWRVSYQCQHILNLSSKAILIIYKLIACIVFAFGTLCACLLQKEPIPRIVINCLTLHIYFFYYNFNNYFTYFFVAEPNPIYDFGEENFMCQLKHSRNMMIIVGWWTHLIVKECGCCGRQHIPSNVDQLRWNDNLL